MISAFVERDFFCYLFLFPFFLVIDPSTPVLVNFTPSFDKLHPRSCDQGSLIVLSRIFESNRTSIQNSIVVIIVMH